MRAINKNRKFKDIIFPPLPPIEGRIGLFNLMERFGFKYDIDNDYHYMSFEMFVISILSGLIIWLGILFFAIFNGGINEIVQIYNLFFFTLIFGTINNFILLPYFIFKTHYLIGFKKDYLLFKRKTISDGNLLYGYKHSSHLSMITIITGQCVCFLSEKAWHRYEIESFIGYTFISGLLLLTLSILIFASLLSLIQHIQKKYRKYELQDLRNILQK